MFGSDLDFFGAYAKRRRAALDFDKRKKLADAQARMESLGQTFDVEKILLGKNRLIEKLTARRHLKHITDQENALDTLRGRKTEAPDPVLAAATRLVDYDRLELLPTLIPTLTPKQRIILQTTLEAHEQRLAASTTESAVTTMDTEPPDDLPPEENGEE